MAKRARGYKDKEEENSQRKYQKLNDGSRKGIFNNFLQRLANPFNTNQHEEDEQGTFYFLLARFRNITCLIHF